MSEIAVGDVRRIRAFDGLKRDAARFIEIASEKQRLRQCREDPDGQDVRARPSGRDRATSVANRGTHVRALDPVRVRDLHDRLGVGRPSLRPLPPRALRHRKQPLNLKLGAREQRRGDRLAGRQRWVLAQQL